MSHNEQANRLGFEKATAIAIDNLDGSSRANTAAFEELKGAINRGLQAHARRLEALEKGVISPSQLIPGLVEQVREMSATLDTHEERLNDIDAGGCGRPYEITDDKARGLAVVSINGVLFEARDEEDSFLG